MVSQQVVSKLFMSDGDATPVLAGQTDYWSTAESYYCAGCFRPVAFLTAIPDESRDHKAVATDEADAASIDVEAQPVPEAIESERIVAVDAPPEPEPPAVEPGATGMGQEAEASVVPVEPDETPIVVSDTIEPGTEMFAAPEPDQKLAPGEIDVLPLPLREEVVGDPPQFGVFADEPATPFRGRPQAEPRSGNQEGFAQQGAYGVPPGHSMRYVDPMDLVRQRAVERAENRRLRIEARKWLGYDPLRPAVNAMPYTSGVDIRPAFVVVPFVVRDER
jgi:hypothetical protein